MASSVFYSAPTGLPTNLTLSLPRLHKGTLSPSGCEAGDPGLPSRRDIQWGSRNKVRALYGLEALTHGFRNGVVISCSIGKSIHRILDLCARNHNMSQALPPYGLPLNQG